VASNQGLSELLHR